MLYWLFEWADLWMTRVLMCIVWFSNLTDGQPSVVLSMLYLPAINRVVLYKSVQLENTDCSSLNLQSGHCSQLGEFVYWNCVLNCALPRVTIPRSLSLRHSLKSNEKLKCRIEQDSGLEKTEWEYLFFLVPTWQQVSSSPFLLFY